MHRPSSAYLEVLYTNAENNIIGILSHTGIQGHRACLGP